MIASGWASAAEASPEVPPGERAFCKAIDTLVKAADGGSFWPHVGPKKTSKNNPKVSYYTMKVEIPGAGTGVLASAGAYVIYRFGESVRSIASKIDACGLDIAELNSATNKHSYLSRGYAPLYLEKKNGQITLRLFKADDRRQPDERCPALLGLVDRARRAELSELAGSPIESAPKVLELVGVHSATVTLSGFETVGVTADGRSIFFRSESHRASNWLHRCLYPPWRRSELKATSGGIWLDDPLSDVRILIRTVAGQRYMAILESPPANQLSIDLEEDGRLPRWACKAIRRLTRDADRGRLGRLEEQPELPSAFVVRGQRDSRPTSKVPRLENRVFLEEKHGVTGVSIELSYPAWEDLLVTEDRFQGALVDCLGRRATVIPGPYGLIQTPQGSRLQLHRRSRYEYALARIWLDIFSPRPVKNLRKVCRAVKRLVADVEKHGRDAFAKRTGEEIKPPFKGEKYEGFRAFRAKIPTWKTLGINRWGTASAFEAPADTFEVLRRCLPWSYFDGPHKTLTHPQRVIWFWIEHLRSGGRLVLAKMHKTEEQQRAQRLRDWQRRLKAERERLRMRQERERRIREAEERVVRAYYAKKKTAEAKRKRTNRKNTKRKEGPCGRGKCVYTCSRIKEVPPPPFTKYAQWSSRPACVDLVDIRTNRPWSYQKIERRLGGGYRCGPRITDTNAVFGLDTRICSSGGLTRPTYDF